MMGHNNLEQTTAYRDLGILAEHGKKSLNLKTLTLNPQRFEQYSLSAGGVFFDYSRQRISNDVLTRLLALSEQTNAMGKFEEMVSGKPVNVTEQRAALHTAARDYADPLTGVMAMVPDVRGQIAAVNRSIENFANNVRSKKITGSSGKPFTDAVVVGIGGSYLGCEFVYSALKVSHEPAIRLHFLANVDIDNFKSVIESIQPDTTLWIVISKSYTTTETMANLEQVRHYMQQHQLAPKQHLVTITAKGSPGDDPANPVLDSFHMFDFIGGRYSVTSAVGALPLSLAFGFDLFQRFLGGCRLMDAHALNAPARENIPLLSALISIWNAHFLNYPAQAIIPYCSGLSRLAPHIQQLYMESLGKGADINNDPVNYPTGVIIFGEPGTCAQHSFFQLAHQGQAFPIEFIGVIHPAFKGRQALSKGVTNHQELWANMIAQANALAMGREDQDPARYCEGNRPSSTLVIPDLSPQSIGALLSYYEARTVFEGFVLGLNPFDQFGVELGKVLASDLRSQMARKNADAGYRFESPDPATRFYLNLLFDQQH